jgi:sterol desaturase/sphingolipid hydroxylase (fatty acid hydroxylase superfamily)
MEAALKTGAEIYASIYFGAIVVVALLEWSSPRRATNTTGVRWFGNFSLTIIGALLVRLLFPLAGVGWAVFCQAHGLGLFNVVLAPNWVAFTLTILVMDATAYAQHYVLHRVPVLWRMHRTHHSDLECDFSTGVRFHPFEAVYSTVIFTGVIFAIGAPPVAVLVSQILTVALDFVEHANVKIPLTIDRALRLIIVTPDMHRIHHSQDMREGNANFSNVFSWWDRLFGTYLDQPAAGHDGMAFGVVELAERKHLTLPWMLAQPFLSPKTSATGVTPVQSPADQSPAASL